ncbi:MAG: FxsA family protein [Nocardioidaceae bacterium]|nr:FxsA family protein [Nocardioidaceae bacterium]
MARWLIAAFLMMPIVEIAVIIQVGQFIGLWPTVLLLVAESVFGAWLVRREGRKAWANLQAMLSAPHAPEVALTDAGLVLVGGALLLTPGFVTDAVGFACLLPGLRPMMRRLVTRALTHRSERSARVRLVGQRRVDPPG